MSKKIAIVSGITGQDGAYLSEFLLSKNYVVYGLYRRSSNPNFWRLDDLSCLNNANLHLVECDITDYSNVFNVINKIKPDEFYNLAAQSFVGVSFSQPISTTMITGVSALIILDCIKSIDTKIKFYQASSSEMFGLVQTVPQNELTPFYPRSPYGVAKLYAHWITINYRESYNLFAVSGILFNHESPLRGIEFVTRKITDGIAKIKLGKLDTLYLGNLDSKRDWGFAGDYVKGMWSMLQNNEPDDFVLATNKTFSVRDFLKKCLEIANIDYQIQGEGVNEEFLDKNNKVIVKIDPKFYRPAEVDLLIGDPSKAKDKLAWNPETSFDKLCELMVTKDLERNK